jgi:hypothetical protein
MHELVFLLTSWRGASFNNFSGARVRVSSCWWWWDSWAGKRMRCFRPLTWAEQINTRQERKYPVFCRQNSRIERYWVQINTRQERIYPEFCRQNSRIERYWVQKSILKAHNYVEATTTEAIYSSRSSRKCCNLSTSSKQTLKTKSLKFWSECKDYLQHWSWENSLAQTKFYENR